MQKVVNVIALLSGLVSLSVVGAGTYVYLNKDALIESAKESVTKAVTSAVSQKVPGMVKSAVPELPTKTGPALPF